MGQEKAVAAHGASPEDLDIAALAKLGEAVAPIVRDVITATSAAQVKVAEAQERTAKLQLEAMEGQAKRHDGWRGKIFWAATAGVAVFWISTIAVYVAGDRDDARKMASYGGTAMAAFIAGRHSPRKDDRGP